MSTNVNPSRENRERAEAAYRAALGRVRDLPGLDIDEVFNKRGPGGGLSLNEVLFSAGYSLEQRGQLLNGLVETQRVGETIRNGELRVADHHVDRFSAIVDTLREGGLLSERQLRAMDDQAKVWRSEIDSERPKVFNEAQKFFAETVARGSVSAEQTEKDSRKFYGMLLNAGLDPERAGVGYHALQDALAARKVQQIMITGEPVEQPLAELSQSIRFAQSGKPSVLDATNLATLGALERDLEKNHRTQAADKNATVIGVDTFDQVPKEYQLDPKALREAALAQVEKMQALVDWKQSKNGFILTGGFYGVPMATIEQKSLPELRKALTAESDGPEQLATLYKAYKQADFQLGHFSKDYRKESPQQIVSRLNEGVESQFRALDATADAIGLLPVVGPRAKFVLKETAIGLRYVRGDMSATEAIAASVKEGISAVVGDVKFKDWLKASHPKLVEQGEDLLIQLGASVAGNVTAELGKVIGKNKLSDIDPEKIVTAISTGIAKGVIEGGFKVAEKYKLSNEQLEEYTKMLIKAAHKFGLERPFDQYIDKEMKSRYQGRVSSIGNEADPEAPTSPRGGHPLYDKALVAISRSDIAGLPKSSPALENLAAALAVDMQLRGVAEIRHLLRNDRGDLIAADGELNASTNRLASVNLPKGSETPAQVNLARLSATPEAAPAMLAATTPTSPDVEESAARRRV